MPQLDLDTLFPPAPPHKKREITRRRSNNGRNLTMHTGKKSLAEISTRWAAMYALELRGCNKSDIAAQLGVSDQAVIAATRDPRYIAYREEHLAALDNDFVAMKPLAFAALSNGLRSQDENTALRASEQWFKGASFGGFAKEPQQSSALTAEDVARQILSGGVSVNVQVNNVVAASSSETDDR